MMDEETQGLLVDLLNALVTFPHQLPPELVGRVLLAVGPHIMNGTARYAPGPPQANERITTWPSSWG